MANYYGTARSNYFRVKHNKFFELCMDRLGVNYSSLTDKNGDTHHSIQPDNDSGTFNSYVEPGNDSVKVLLELEGINETVIIDRELLDSSLSDDAAVDKFFLDNGVPPDAVVEVSAFEDDSFEFDLFQEVAVHLTEDSVAVFLEAGAEKLRYIIGNAVAVNHKGEVEMIVLDNIYEKAAKAFGVEQNSIATCEYTNHVMKSGENDG